MQPQEEKTRIKASSKQIMTAPRTLSSRAFGWNTLNSVDTTSYQHSSWVPQTVRRLSHLFLSFLWGSSTRMGRFNADGCAASYIAGVLYIARSAFQPNPSNTRAHIALVVSIYPHNLIVLSTSTKQTAGTSGKVLRSIIPTLPPRYIQMLRIWTQTSW